MARIFVYGTLKRGHCRAHVLAAQQFVGEAKTVARYRLYDAGPYPALVHQEPGAEIEGEVWEVDDQCLAEIDAVEGVPELYERRPIQLSGHPSDSVQAYYYCSSVTGMADCGRRWNVKPSVRGIAHPS